MGGNDKWCLTWEGNVIDPYFLLCSRLPVHLALLHTTDNQIPVVQLLLEGMLCNRMENKGLDLWKTNMMYLLKSMETHERNFTTRDKLDMICEEIREFMERVFTLELAVWRASCLQFDTRFSSVQGVLDHESSIVAAAAAPFDAHEYKVDRRIRSGADIIVRDVIPFLEDEPVQDLIQKFRDYWGRFHWLERRGFLHIVVVDTGILTRHHIDIAMFHHDTSKPHVMWTLCKLYDSNASQK